MRDAVAMLSDTMHRSIEQAPSGEKRDALQRKAVELVEDFSDQQRRAQRRRLLSEQLPDGQRTNQRVHGVPSAPEH